MNVKCVSTTSNAADLHLKLYIKASEAERVVGVERRTLFRWAKSGKLPFTRQGKRGHWMFDRQAIYDLTGCRPPLQVEQPPESSESKNCIEAIYARVSTRKQLNDLQSQIRTLTTKYPDHVVFSDCASGLNFKRKGLLSLLQLAFEGRLRLVRIAHRDRLCRFAFDLLEYVFIKHGAKIHVEASDLPSSAESELAQDVLAVITVFGARLHGARSAGRRKKPTQGEETGLGGGDRTIGGEEVDSCLPYTPSTHHGAA